MKEEKIDLVQKAVKEYLDRKAGISKPKGEAVWTGSKAKFIIADEEKRDCCKAVSGSMLFSHTFSVKHIASLFGVSVNSINIALKELRANEEKIS